MCQIVWFGMELGTVYCLYCCLEVIGEGRNIWNFAIPFGDCWRLLRSAATQPKVEFFLWRLLWGILRRRQIQVDNNYCVYGSQDESFYHVFFECNFSLEVWRIVCSWLVLSLEVWLSSMEFWLIFLIKAKQEGDLELVLKAALEE